MPDLHANHYTVGIGKEKAPNFPVSQELKVSEMMIWKAYSCMMIMVIDVAMMIMILKMKTSGRERNTTCVCAVPVPVPGVGNASRNDRDVRSTGGVGWGGVGLKHHNLRQRK